LLVALLAGVMSACFALGLQAGEPLIVEGTKELFKTLPATFVVTCGGFLTNAVFCLYQNTRNKSFKDYKNTSVLTNNLLFCTLAGILWYSQFFGLSIGKSFLEPGSVMLAFSWCILMTLNICFSNVWGILLKEWKGVSTKTIVTLVTGLTILIFSLVFPNL
jgi:L-rhamnose-H+ transport protein